LGGGLQYILDANTFIEASNRYYAYDVAPGFWRSIEYHGAQGTLASLDRVRDELREGEDMVQWKKGSGKHLFLSSNEPDVISAYREVVRWVHGQDRFRPEAKAAFADIADAWLIAYAKAKGVFLVTHEEPAPQAKKKVKIPDVCRAFGVIWKNTFAMLRELGVSYGWEQPPSAE